jgi:acetate kinase
MYRNACRHRYSPTRHKAGSNELLSRAPIRQLTTANANVISTGAGRVAVRVTLTDEELMIARSVIRVLGSRAQKES